MRKPNTLFDQVCQFVNSFAIGEQFDTQDMYAQCNENMTHWKRSNNYDHYTTRQYRRHLVIAGVLAHVKRGKWRVLAHIPDHVTVSALEANRNRKVRNEKTGEWRLCAKPWNASMMAIKEEVQELAKPEAQERRISMMTVYTINNNKIEFKVIPVNSLHATLSSGNVYATLAEAEAMILPEWIEPKVQLKRVEVIAEPVKSNKMVWQIQGNSIVPVPQNSGGNTFLSLQDAHDFLEAQKLNDKINSEKTNESITEPIKVKEDIEDGTSINNIIIPNYLNSEVYWHRDGVFFKGKITGYQVSISSSISHPKMYDIVVEVLSSTNVDDSGDEEYFDNIAGLSFTKDDFLKEISDLVDFL